jgi:hypothetical protein
MCAAQDFAHGHTRSRESSIVLTAIETELSQLNELLIQLSSSLDSAAQPLDQDGDEDGLTGRFRRRCRDQARLRANTTQDQAVMYFARHGIEIQNIDFHPVTVVGTTPYQSRRDAPHADCYTQEQSLRVQIEMVGEPGPLPSL